MIGGILLAAAIGVVFGSLFLAAEECGSPDVR